MIVISVKHFLLYFFLFVAAQVSFPLLADDQLYQIHADSIQYDGQEVIFTDNVVCVHEDGKVTAQFAKVFPSAKGSSEPVAKIEFADDVTIHMSDRLKMTCDCADVDFSSRIITLKGKEKQPLCYTDGLSLVSLKSQEATVYLDEERSFQKIVFVKDVEICHSEKFTVYGQRAIFSQDGSLTLFPEPLEDQYCVIDLKNRGQCQSLKVFFQTKERFLQLTSSKGHLNIFGKKAIDFTSDLATWDENTQELKMKGNTFIKQPFVANLENDQCVTLFWKEDEPTSVTCLGVTKFHSLNDKGGIGYTLMTDGLFEIDYQKQCLKVVKQQKQIQYNDRIGHVFGDYLLADYGVEEGGSLSPKKVFLEGNLRLIGNSYSISEEMISTTQYAIADSLVYTPENREVMLFSKDSGRVLFYDKMNNLQVSAPKIKYSNEENGKIQGIGDVRLKFLKKEFEQLKKRFNLDY